MPDIILLVSQLLLLVIGLVAVVLAILVGSFIWALYLEWRSP